jgi:hypothetical protein
MHRPVQRSDFGLSAAISADADRILRERCRAETRHPELVKTHLGPERPGTGHIATDTFDGAGPAPLCKTR